MKTFERIGVHGLLIGHAFMHTETIDLSTRPGTQTHRRALTPGPMSFAISLAVYIEKGTRTCPPCGYDENAEVNDNQEEEID
jgi:hypothetical protein